MIRSLGDGESSLLFLARDSDKSLLNFHLSTLNGKLQDIVTYLIVQSRPGWLIASITSNNSFTSSGNENAKMKFDHFDYDLINILNALIKAMASYNSNLTLFDKKEYVMAVDVKKSIEALGGIEAIYHDVAKERALARLIQADGHEVHMEIVEFIKQTQGEDGQAENNRMSRVSIGGFIFRRSTGGNSNNNNMTRDGSSFSSYQTSDDYSRQHNRGFFSRYLCCCLTKRNDPEYQKNKKYRIQLEEPLVR